MPPRQFAQLRRQGEGEHEIAFRHLQPDLPLQPLLALVMLAMRTTAVPARMRHEALFVAGAAVREHARRHGSAAMLHGRERLPLAGQNRVPVLVQGCRLKAGDDRGQGNHLTVPH
jgi:hypothetical protein